METIIRREKEGDTLKEKTYEFTGEAVIIDEAQQTRELLELAGMDSDIIEATIQKMREDGLVSW